MIVDHRKLSIVKWKPGRVGKRGLKRTGQNMLWCVPSSRPCLLHILRWVPLFAPHLASLMKYFHDWPSRAVAVVWRRHAHIMWLPTAPDRHLLALEGVTTTQVLACNFAMVTASRASVHALRDWDGSVGLTWWRRGCSVTPLPWCAWYSDFLNYPQKWLQVKDVQHYELPSVKHFHTHNLFTLMFRIHYTLLWFPDTWASTMAVSSSHFQNTGMCLLIINSVWSIIDYIASYRYSILCKLSMVI